MDLFLVEKNLVPTNFLEVLNEFNTVNICDKEFYYIFADDEDLEETLYLYSAENNKKILRKIADFIRKNSIKISEY